MLLTTTVQYCVWLPLQLNKLLLGGSRSATERTDPCKSHASTNCHAVKSLIGNPVPLGRAECRQERASPPSAICSDWKLAQIDSISAKTWKVTTFSYFLLLTYWPEGSIFAPVRFQQLLPAEGCFADHKHTKFIQMNRMCSTDISNLQTSSSIIRW